MKRYLATLQNYLLKEINAVIRYLIISDVVLTGAAALLAPIFAIFIEDFIRGGNAAVAGVAAGIYLFTKSIAQIPAAMVVDKIRGEKDDFYIMFIFTLLMAVIPLLYLVIDTPLGLYVVQFVLGLLTAFTYPSYMAIFTRHIDKTKEGTEWGTYFTLTDLASAGLSAIGGVIATTVGFPALIVAVVILSFIGSLLLFPIKPYLKFAHHR
ncbi:MFS transporter [Candidatus Wolfebacteria bacterium]|nr:MFS transporter [Candidatus Wolfebacteria bacterium]